MKPVLTLLLLLGIVAPVKAHPGVGIVQDRRGNIYFTDLKQVWKITADGKQTVVVPAVHTHELFLDADDNLFGEHLSYEGETGKWRFRVWRLSPDGTLSDIIPTTEGMRADYSFVRDSKGTMYWADHANETVIKKRTKGGQPTTHAAGTLRRVSWMTVTADGILYLMDSGDLRRIAQDGSVTTVVARLTGLEKPTPNVSDLNYHMGLWTDEDGAIYVAVAAERLVVRVTADGMSSVVAKSSAPWSPSGGMVDREGHLWLLEYDAEDKARVRRIDKNGRDQDKVFNGESPRG